MSFLKDTVIINKNTNESDNEDDRNENENGSTIATESQRNEDAEIERTINTLSSINLPELFATAMSNLQSNTAIRNDVVLDEDETKDSNPQTQQESYACSSLHNSISNINNEELAVSSQAKAAQEAYDKELAQQMQLQEERLFQRQLRGYPANTRVGYRMVPQGGVQILFKDSRGRHLVSYQTCGRPNCKDCSRVAAAKREMREKQAYGTPRGAAAANGHSNHAAVARNTEQGAGNDRTRDTPQHPPGEKRRDALPHTQQNGHRDVKEASNGPSSSTRRDNEQTHRSNPQTHRSNPQAHRLNPQADRSNPQADRSNPQADRSNPQADRLNPQAGTGGARPRVLILRPVRASRPRESRGLDLLREGSRVQPAFTRDEWTGMQANPFRLLDFLGNRRAAVRRMQMADIDSADYEGLWELAERLGEVKKRGLDPQDIDRMPTLRFQDSDNMGTNPENEDKEQCKICLTEFSEGDRLRTLPCLHRFHQQCIDKWIKGNAVCPICRMEIKEALKGSRGEKQ